MLKTLNIYRKQEVRIQQLCVPLKLGKIYQLLVSADGVNFLGETKIRMIEGKNGRSLLATWGKHSEKVSG
jgi:hypothetical protein